MGKVILPLLLLLAMASASFSQSVTTDSLAKKITTIEESLSGLKKVKFSGYIQAQWQKAEAAGIKSVAGGNFDPNMDNRFLLRRSRLKMTYTSDPILAVIQVDAGPTGVVVRDAFGAVKMPGAFKNLSLQGGLFLRPFGHELLFSSTLRESPERARMHQTIFPNERDLGFKLAYKYHSWLLEGSLVNGNSIALENDSRKDFIGRLSTPDIKLGKVLIVAGISFYEGGVRQGTNHVYDFDGDHFTAQDTTKGSLIGQHAQRRYLGRDIQLSFPWAAGKTTLRGEHIVGTQPGTATSSDSPRNAALPDKDTYIRPFRGAVFYFIQNIAKSNWQAVVKYDFYDPNREVSNDQIGAANSLTNEGDIKYTTLGLGLNYYYKSVTFMAYYDMVENETTINLSSYTKDVKDNVFTLRVQYKY
ncbi:MAG: hypothetical protein HY842_00650 [Bacteroidetes bacterium]|nr:hypothetical protein [Bacteroidota bacterium]